MGIFDPSLVLWIVGFLGISSTGWNVFVLAYCAHAHQFNTEITAERPLKRWILRALTFLVAIETFAVVTLTVVQLLRNYYLVEAVGAEFAPHWLFWIVIVQNVFFYGLTVLPAVILYAYTWALKTLVQDREDTLSDAQRDELGLNTQSARTANRARRRKQQHQQDEGYP